MAKTKKTKELILNQYEKLIKDYSNIVLIDIEKVKNLSVEKFKNSIQDGKYILLKNTIFKKVISSNGIEIPEIQGSTGAFFIKEDNLTEIKKLIEFINENKTVTIRFGLISNNIYNSNEIIEISKLPSKNELVAKIIGNLKSPIISLLNNITGKQKEFIYILKKIESTK